MLLRTVREPDLLKLLDTFKNPALLCYYFFYPAHDEALHESCTNVEAREFAAFGGEWSCMALLLQRDDPTAKFRPSYIGHTGRLLPPDASGVSPPQAPDSDDAARRIVMVVAPFANPGKIDEHPRLLVAKGTHGLYFDPGSVNVIYPDDLAPSECGKFD